MSLVVAIQVTNNDVVVAADRRATFGDPRGLVALDEGVCKIIPFGEGAALGIVGMPAAVYEPIKNVLPVAEKAPINDRLHLLHDALKQHYNKHFGIRPFVSQAPVQDSRPQVEVTYVDRRPNGTGIYTLPSGLNFTPMPMGRPYALSGVANYALYLYQRLWRPNLTADQAAELAALLITETGKLDPKVGTEPDILILEPSATRRFENGQIERIIKANDARMSRLARSFNGGKKP
jgi:hypothetical protein